MPGLADHISQLTTGQGWNAGHPFMLFRWQHRFLNGTFGREFVQGDSCMTLGRGGGKSTLVATVGEATLDGPLVEHHTETVLCAPSLNTGTYHL